MTNKITNSSGNPITSSEQGKKEPVQGSTFKPPSALTELPIDMLKGRVSVIVNIASSVKTRKVATFALKPGILEGRGTVTKPSDDEIPPPPPVELDDEIPPPPPIEPSFVTKGAKSFNWKIDPKEFPPAPKGYEYADKYPDTAFDDLDTPKAPPKNIQAQPKIRERRMNVMAANLAPPIPQLPDDYSEGSLTPSSGNLTTESDS